ncbi:MAG: hypothetical protein LBN02_06075 [Oscillospiraceae bacterium]|jgi:hypothetical protein|nr:hypothetical protein [Oscillospiraceae bacterium]
MLIVFGIVAGLLLALAELRLIKGCIARALAGRRASTVYGVAVTLLPICALTAAGLARADILPSIGAAMGLGLAVMGFVSFGVKNTEHRRREE